MLLSDRSIKEEIAAGRIVVKPYSEEFVQPASIDVHLSNQFLIFNRAQHSVIDIKKKPDDLMREVRIAEDPFILHPGEFVLGSTVEWIQLPNNISARIEGKSSLGRIGLLIHSTAGWVDAGWKGNLTLELSNVSPLPVTLYSNMKIGQVSFMKMTTEVDNPYGSAKLKSHYQGQRAPAPSKYYKEFEKQD